MAGKFNDVKIVPLWRTKKETFFTSIVITPEIYNELDKLEVGGKFTLSIMTGEKAKEGSPDAYLNFTPKVEVDKYKAASAARTAQSEVL